MNMTDFPDTLSKYVPYINSSVTVDCGLCCGLQGLISGLIWSRAVLFSASVFPKTLHINVQGQYQLMINIDKAKNVFNVLLKLHIV